MAIRPSPTADIVAERIGQKLFGENPDLRERAEKQAWEMTDKFEGELAKGRIVLNLFTEEELLLPFNHLQEEFDQPVTEMQPTDELQKRSFDAIVQAIKDILTPERFLHLRKGCRIYGQSLEARAAEMGRCPPARTHRAPEIQGSPKIGPIAG